MSTLYLYRCTGCGDECEIRHPMAEVGQPRRCAGCGEPLQRVYTPTHHRWPSNYLPGNEDSGQRMFLDPEFRARHKDYYAREKALHLEREEAEGGA